MVEVRSTQYVKYEVQNDYFLRAHFVLLREALGEYLRLTAPSDRADSSQVCCQLRTLLCDFWSRRPPSANDDTKLTSMALLSGDASSDPRIVMARILSVHQTDKSVKWAFGNPLADPAIERDLALVQLRVWISILCEEESLL